jgi:hypothetical protein
LASPVEPEVNRIVASSSGATSGRRSSSRAVEQARRAPARWLFDRQVTTSQLPQRRDPLGARRVGDDQLGLGQLQRMLQLVALPPAVEQASRPRPP